MTLTHTADMLDEIVSMVIEVFPGWYQLVSVIMMNKVARPNKEWNMDLIIPEKLLNQN